MTEEDKSMIWLVSTYGAGLSLSGSRVQRKSKDIAKSLIERGYLSGTLRSLDVTDKGRAVLAAEFPND